MWKGTVSFNVGETVGPYRIIEQLGQGGMATVFKAYHAALDRYVALKVLHPAFLEDANFLARFQREARTVAKLDHPNIVPVYDFAEHEGRPYLVMKFIEGETLKARLSHGPVETEEMARAAEAVGAALTYAHKRGILHRDIKPSNVLLAADGGIYLADFGLARIAQSGESTLTTDTILGTPQYISPEQALGKKELDEGTDIYSFGVMMYELIVGDVPFSADTPFSVIHDHIYTPLPMPRQLNPAVSEALERVLLKALAKERRDRYKDVQAMLEAFQAAWEEEAAGEAAPAATLASVPSPTVRAADRARDEAPTGATPAPAETLAAGDGPLVGLAAEGSDPADQPVKKRGRLVWMWLSVAVVLVLICLVTLGALRSIRIPGGDGWPSGQRTPASLGTPEDEVARARQYAAEHPGDPNAHLQLALVYARAGENEKSQQAITDLEEAGGYDEAFLWDAVRQLAASDSWLGAARLAIDAAEMRAAGGAALPPDLAVLLHETVYKAAKDELAGTYFEFERINTLDEPLARLAKARYTFLNADRRQGQQALDDLMQIKPGFSEAQLCQADFSARLGDTQRARQALDDLRAHPDLPEWVVREAEIIERTLP